MRLILQRLHGAWFALHFLLFFIVFFLFFYLFLKVPFWHRKAHVLRRVWAKYIFFMAGIRWEATYEAPLDPGKTYVITPNHSSYLDIPSLAIMFPYHFVFMAKHELSKIPGFGIFFKTLDIGVNRKQIFEAHKAFLKAGEKLREGTSICIFPEGTIHKDAPILSKFKDGAFRLAIENQVDIVPVTLPDNFRRLPDDGRWLSSPGKMRMYVHRSIPTKGLKVEQADELKQEVFSIIESKLKEYACY